MFPGQDVTMYTDSQYAFGSVCQRAQVNLQPTNNRCRSCCKRSCYQKHWQYANVEPTLKAQGLTHTQLANVPDQDPDDVLQHRQDNASDQEQCPLMTF